MTLRITWTESSGRHGRAWTLTADDDPVATAGETLEPFGRGRPVGFNHWLMAGGGHRIWFPSEASLREFVAAALADGPLCIGDRLEAVFVGMNWAHGCAYPYDRDGNPHRPLPERFDADRDEARDRLLPNRGDTDESLEWKAEIVLLTAHVVWRELRAVPITERPFPILQ